MNIFGGVAVISEAWVFKCEEMKNRLFEHVKITKKEKIKCEDRITPIEPWWSKKENSTSLFLKRNDWGSQVFDYSLRLTKRTRPKGMAQI